MYVLKLNWTWTLYLHHNTKPLYTHTLNPFRMAAKDVYITEQCCSWPVAILVWLLLQPAWLTAVHIKFVYVFLCHIHYFLYTSIPKCLICTLWFSNFQTGPRTSTSFTFIKRINAVPVLHYLFINFYCFLKFLIIYKQNRANYEITTVFNIHY